MTSIEAVQKIFRDEGSDLESLVWDFAGERFCELLDEAGFKVVGKDNGWPGVFIPGDEALGLANSLRKISDALERKSIETWQATAFMNHTADMLETCAVKDG